MIWRVLARFPFLEISENGLLRRLTDAASGPAKAGYMYKQKRMPNGYYMARVNPGNAQETINIMLHRLVAEAFLGPAPANTVVDHIDSNRGNNHYTNLRYCLQRDNCVFASSSNHLGVTRHKRDKYWQASYGIERRSVYLGSFKTLEEAQQAYKNADIEFRSTGVLTITRRNGKTVTYRRSI